MRGGKEEYDYSFNLVIENLLFSTSEDRIGDLDVGVYVVSIS